MAVTDPTSISATISKGNDNAVKEGMNFLQFIRDDTESFVSAFKQAQTGSDVQQMRALDDLLDIIWANYALFVCFVSAI